MNRVDDFSIVTVDRRDVPMFVVGRNVNSREEWLDAMAFARDAAAKMEGLDCRVFVAEPTGSSEWLVSPADSAGFDPVRLVSAPDAETAVRRTFIIEDYEPF